MVWTIWLCGDRGPLLFVVSDSGTTNNSGKSGGPAHHLQDGTIDRTARTAELVAP